MGGVEEFAQLTYSAARDAGYLYFQPLVQLWDWLSQQTKSGIVAQPRSDSFLPSTRWGLNLVRQLNTALISLNSRLWAARLMDRTRRVEVNRLRSLLIDLELRRQYLRPLWEASPPFRDYVSKMVIVVVQGQETPLATLVFSDALKALGYRTRTYEDFPQVSGKFVEEFRKLPRFTRLAIVLGHGVDEARVPLLAEFFNEWGVEVSLVPLFLPGGLFPDGLLYNLVSELHVGLKDYLQEAASLAKSPDDKQFEDRAKHVSPIYR